MQPTIDICDNNIIIRGHYDDNIKCAKLTLLCQIFNANINNDEVILTYNKDFLNKLSLIDDLLIFACPGGSCTGDCSTNCGAGCGQTCSGECSGNAGSCGATSCRTACGNCDINCGTVCNYGCDGSCNTGCDKTCTGDCDRGCKGGCYGDCDGGCKDGCDSGCKNGCYGGCADNCSTSCEGGCSTKCSGGCKTNCDDGCTGNAVTPVYIRIKDLYKRLQLGEIIYANEFTDIETLIRNEATRRKKTPYSKESEKIGEIIYVNSPNLLVKDLNNMSKTFNSLIAGDITLAEITKKYIQAGIELYETIVNPGP